MPRGQTFKTYTDLPLNQSAQVTLTFWQWLILFVLVSVLIAGLVWSWAFTLAASIALLMVVYLADMAYVAVLATRSLLHPPEIVIPATTPRRDIASLPVYSILCPLYKEAAILEQFVTSISALDWPKDKLDVQLLLEEDDPATRQAAERLQLPAWFKVTIVPAGLPKTKPKACNYGLGKARGDYVVIYDAEDIPEPGQLRAVYEAFQQLPADVACVQAKLGYYNARQNLLTRLFAIEYAPWFGLVLPGLQSLMVPLPLGGTSNHFRRSVLQSLHGWDPFNVTEDCDLGIRLFRHGFRTAIIDSHTHEEATSRVGSWLRQRSRWIKGYMQTYAVTMRHPQTLLKRGAWPFLSFQLTVGGKVLSLFVNPLSWLLTIGYLLSRSAVGPVIDILYPGPLLYIGGLSLVLGNFLYFYIHLLAVAKTEQWWLLRTVWLLPAYWLLMSVAAWLALWQLITKPHYWEKTNHGLHLVRKPKAVLAVGKLSTV